MFRFAPAAAVALAASQLTYFLCGSVWHLTGRVTGAAAWLAGVVVSYLVSRWAWERRGRPRLLAETLPFVAISVATGAVLIEASHRGYLAAGALGLHGWAFHLATQGFYLATNVVTFLVRFLIFNFILFAERNASPAGPSPAGTALPRRSPARRLWRPAPVNAGHSTGPGTAGQQGTTAPRRRLARGLWQLAYEFAKFAVVGACALLVAGKEVITLSLQAGAGPQTATVAALAATTTASFAGNRYWTFRHRARSTVGREGLLYLLLTVPGLVIEAGGMQLAAELGPRSGPPYGPAVVTAFALAALFRYWSCRTWVWRGTWSHLSHTGQVVPQ
jgi:putative flippase GtrA